MPALESSGAGTRVMVFYNGVVAKRKKRVNIKDIRFYRVWSLIREGQFT